MGSKWRTADAVRNIKISFFNCRLIVVTKSSSFGRVLISSTSLNFPLPLMLFLSVFVLSSSFVGGAGNTCVVLLRRSFGNVNITSDAKNMLVDTNIKPDEKKENHHENQYEVEMFSTKCKRHEFSTSRGLWHFLVENVRIFCYDFVLIIHFFCARF